ncbi:MAG: GWxTD domain-containing protein, partial [candidate division Zixibacteria bacterium]|nr:GWxTD domain-containing protein [candidate division Zixibacteria bacterium]
MNRFLKTILIGLAMSVIAVTVVWGQTGYRPKYEFGEARFAVDAVDFRSDTTGINDVEVYFKVFNDALSYRKTDSGYLAEYEVVIVVEGDDGRQIASQTKNGRIDAANFAETKRSGDFIINVVNFTLPAQDLSVRAILTDKTAQNSQEEKVTLKKRDYWAKYPVLSRVQFARDISPITVESKFNKDGMRVIPNVVRLYGRDNDSILQFYEEIYPGESTDKYCKLITRIYHRTRGTVHADTLLLGDLTAVQKEHHTIDVSNLAPGDYELDLRIEGRRGRLYDQLTAPFELELTAESMARNDYPTAVEMLKYLANKGEIDLLKKAKTPEERKATWDAFWITRSKEPRDEENPTKEEYFRRIRHANRYFSYMKREGWRTGRGMIYITYGEPEEIEDYPFELATKPYQIWHYYRTVPSRSFWFVDNWGDGNYEL